MTRVTHVSYTDNTFTFAVETCHLVHRYQHSRTACVFCLQRMKRNLGTILFFCSTERDSKFVQYVGMWQHIPVDSNCHGHCCQNCKSYKTFPGLMKNRLTISVNMTLNKSHSRLMMDTSCQPDTPSTNEASSL